MVLVRTSSSRSPGELFHYCEFVNAGQALVRESDYSEAKCYLPGFWILPVMFREPLADGGMSRDEIAVG